MHKNVLISDANHGGLILLEEYAKYTSNNLFFYDIYDKLSTSEKEKLTKKYNVQFLSLNEIKASEDNFIKINPVHMPPVIGTDYTHHEFVAYLLKKHEYKFKIIQVTGVKGKTTVTTLIKEVLKDYNVLTLTSNALTYNNTTLIKHLSITPASIITALNHTKQENIIDSIDYCVFEVSLGVVPHNYMNILTNILEDYPIARHSSSASVAKRGVFTSDITLCDYDTLRKYYSENSAVTISLDDNNADIYTGNINYNITDTTFTVNYLNRKLEISTFALSDFYIKNLVFAISVGFMEGIDENKIISYLKEYNNIPGRNSYRKIDDKIIIEDINPGLNTTSIRKCIENLEKFNQEATLIIGGDYGITCEEIDEKKLAEYINTLNHEHIIFTGEVGRNIKKKIKNESKHFNQLNDAIKYALNNNNTLIQIIYRSRYTKYDKDLEY